MSLLFALANTVEVAKAVAALAEIDCAEAAVDRAKAELKTAEAAAAKAKADAEAAEAALPDLYRTEQTAAAYAAKAKADAEAAEAAWCCAPLYEAACGPEFSSAYAEEELWINSALAAEAAQAAAEAAEEAEEAWLEAAEKQAKAKAEAKAKEAEAAKAANKKSGASAALKGVRKPFNALIRELRKTPGVYDAEKGGYRLEGVLNFLGIVPEGGLKKRDLKKASVELSRYFDRGFHMAKREGHETTDVVRVIRTTNREVIFGIAELLRNHGWIFSQDGKAVYTYA